MLGPAGSALGAALFLMVANPLAGAANGAAWLPSPWGDVGQSLPVGAAISIARSGAYFDGRATGTPWLVLGLWSLAGLALVVAGHHRSTRSTQSVVRWKSSAPGSTSGSPLTKCLTIVRVSACPPPTL